MKFKFGKKTYILEDGVVLTTKGNPAQNQDKLLQHINRYKKNLRDHGFNLRMNYQNFELYLQALDTSEKENLFHTIYDHYLAANDLLSEKRTITQSDFFKVMANLKRYEQYLYKIISS